MIFENKRVFWISGLMQEQLLIDMLSVDPNRRPEVKDILSHPSIRVKLETTSRKAKITPFKTNNQTVPYMFCVMDHGRVFLK